MTKNKNDKRKLSLAKKRVRKLNDSELEDVGGGWDSGVVAPLTADCPTNGCAILLTDGCATGGCRLNYTRLNHNQALRG